MTDTAGGPAKVVLVPRGLRDDDTDPYDIHAFADKTKADAHTLDVSCWCQPLRKCEQPYDLHIYSHNTRVA